LQSSQLPFPGYAHLEPGCHPDRPISAFASYEFEYPAGKCRLWYLHFVNPQAIPANASANKIAMPLMPLSMLNQNI
jgi:hypothetical protein